MTSKDSSEVVEKFAYAAWVKAASSSASSTKAFMRRVEAELKDLLARNPDADTSDIRDTWLDSSWYYAKPAVNNVNHWMRPVRATIPPNPMLREAILLAVEGLRVTPAAVQAALEELIVKDPDQARMLPATRSTASEIIGLWPEFREVFLALLERRNPESARNTLEKKQRNWDRKYDAVRDLLTVEPAPARDISPIELGLSSWLTDDEAPPYVSRDIDERLAASLMSGKPGLTVLVGNPKAGKSRAILEALQRNLPDTEVWWLAASHNVLPEFVSQIAKNKLHPDLIVIDDAQLHTPNPVEGITANRLRKLSEKHHVVVTIHSYSLAQWERQTKDSRPPAAGLRNPWSTRTSPTGADRALVTLLRSNQIDLDSVLTERELKSAKEIMGTNAHKLKGLDLTRLGEVLASVPQMLQQIAEARIDRGYNLAMLETAIDTAIAYPQGATINELRELAQTHLAVVEPNAFWDEADFKKALQWATTGLSAGSPHAILVKRASGGYALFEALEQHLVEPDRELGHLDQVENLSPEAHYNVGVWAMQWRRTGLAKPHLRDAIDSGYVPAFRSMAKMLEDSSRDDHKGIRFWYRKAIANGDLTALIGLADFEQHEGFMLRTLGSKASMKASTHYDTARSLYKEALRRGDDSAIENLARLSKDEGDLEAERYWWEKALEQEIPGANIALGCLDEREGHLDDARGRYQRANVQHPAIASYFLGRLDEKQGDLERARHHMAEAAYQGDIKAIMWTIESDKNGNEQENPRPYFLEPIGRGVKLMADFGYFEQESGRIQEARYWYRQAIDNGIPWGFFFLFYLEEEEEKSGNVPEDIREWARKAISQGETEFLFHLALLEEKAGDFDAARHAYRSAILRKDTRATASLTDLELRLDNGNEARVWYQDAVEKGFTWLLVELASLEAKAGHIDSARKYYRKALEHDPSMQLHNFVSFETFKGHPGAAEDLCRMSIDRGETWAYSRLGRLKEVAGQTEAARSLFRKAIVNNDDMGYTHLARLERLARNYAVSRYYYQAAIDRGLRGSVFNLALMEGEAGNFDDEREWRHQALEQGPTWAISSLARIIVHNADPSIRDWYQKILSQDPLPA